MDNYGITYFFPDGVELLPVSVESPHLPGVGERVAIHPVERVSNPEPKYAYDHDDTRWIVGERIFVVTVPTTRKNIVSIDTTQRVEIYLTAKAIDQGSRPYNPCYGDDRMCVFGHPYHRHFDSYNQMKPVGCKYCSREDCRGFEEKRA